jgi:cold shock CspA family protein
MSGESFVGAIVAWDTERGFGWIARDDGERDAFVHIRECLTENGEFAIGTRVRFKFGESQRTGRLQAYDCAAIAAEPPNSMSFGTITAWDNDGRYFFIRPDDGSEDVFAHHSAARGETPVGARVSYTYGINPRTGRTRALAVRRFEDASSSCGIEKLKFMQKGKL